MSAQLPVRSGKAWLELLLVLAFLTLLFQMFPSFWFRTVSLLDVRDWSRWAWLWLNIGVVLLLCGIRFGPELYVEWRARQTRRGVEREKQQTQQELKEQRKLFERLREARKRRLF